MKKVKFISILSINLFLALFIVFFSNVNIQAQTNVDLKTLLTGSGTWESKIWQYGDYKYIVRSYARNVDVLYDEEVILESNTTEDVGGVIIIKIDNANNYIGYSVTDTLFDYELKTVSTSGDKLCFGVVYENEEEMDSFKVYSVDEDLKVKPIFVNEGYGLKKVGIKDSILYIGGYFSEVDNYAIVGDTLEGLFGHYYEPALFNLIIDTKKDSVLYKGVAGSGLYNKVLGLVVDDNGDVLYIATFLGDKYIIGRDTFDMHGLTNNQVKLYRENSVIYKLTKEGEVVFINAFQSNDRFVGAQKFNSDKEGNIYVEVISKAKKIYYGDELLYDNSDGILMTYFVKLDPKGKLLWKTWMKNGELLNGSILISGDDVMYLGDDISSNRLGVEIQGIEFPYLGKRALYLFRFDKNTGEYKSSSWYKQSFGYNMSQIGQDTICMYGVYTLSEVIDEDDLSLRRYCVFNRVGESTSVKDKTKSNSRIIYPNPISQGKRIKIKNEKLNVVEVEILDMSGRRIIVKDKCMDEIISIDTNTFKSGIYLVNIRYKDQGYIEKIIVK